MRELTCFVIIPSNRNKQANSLMLRDDRWGLVEFPSGCNEAKTGAVELDFETVYKEIIQEAIENINQEYKKQKIQIKYWRGQDLNEPGDVVVHILRDICTADLTITDITTNNPNVFLEYGIRLSVKEDESNIMICHESAFDKMPFDVKKLRCIPYSLGAAGANKAKKDIVGFISTFVRERFLQDSTIQPTRPDDSSLYKRLVELYTGRKLERELINALEKTPKLVADLTSFLLTNEKNPGLKQEVFKFFQSITEVLKTDPKGQSRAFEHLELISKIKGLSSEKLLDIYYELAELCGKDPNLKDKAAYYREAYKKLEK